MLHLDAPAMSVVWQGIGDRFTVSPDAPDRLVSPRVERERLKALRLIGVRAEAGEKGATARWSKEKKPHGKHIANACGRNAVPVANDASKSRAEESREDQKQQHGGLPFKDEAVGGSNPGTSALRLRLAEEGLDLTWPAADKRATVEAAVARCGVEGCVKACLADAAGKEKPPASIGFFAPTLARLRPPPEPDAPKPFSVLDLAWIERLPDTKREEARARWESRRVEVEGFFEPCRHPQALAQAADALRLEFSQ